MENHWISWKVLEMCENEKKMNDICISNSWKKSLNLEADAELTKYMDKFIHWKPRIVMALLPGK